MKDVTIIFTRSKKRMPIFSWAVRLWTWKPYSHVVRYKKILNEDMYYQASEGKVNYEHSNIFFKKNEIVKKYIIQVPDTLEREMSRSCLQEAGQPYASLQNLGIAIVDIFSLFGKKIGNPWKKGRNCSELLYINILKPMNPDLDYDQDTIKPHHIEDILTTKYR